MRHGRLITTLLAALAVMAIAPAWAAAAPGSFTDGPADFLNGTRDANAALAGSGSVQLNGTLTPQTFGAGPGVPAGMTATPWIATGAATVSATGVLTADAALVSANQANGSGQVVEFNATFTGVAGVPAAHQSLGFAGSLNDGPWAVFTTGDGVGGELAVSTRDAAGVVTGPTAIPGLNPASGPHAYRIEWSAHAVRYLVDGVVVATHAVSIASAMPFVVSDFDLGGGSMTASSFGRTVFTGPGTFTSVVHNVADARARWSVLTPTVGTTSESAVAFKTRSGNTPTPDATWSNLADVGNGGAITSPPGQYIQYQAVLSSTATNVTPSLDQVRVDYDVDTTAPTTSINDVQVSGTTATVSFSSSATDVGHFDCSVDGGTLATCTSPKDFTGLASGPHSVSVQAVDTVGNVGAPDAKVFNIADPVVSGGSGAATTTTTTQQPSAGSSATDKTKPKVSVVARSLKVSKTGTVSFRVGCPKTETSCKIQLQLKNGKKVAAKKTVTVKGGKTVTVTLQLTKATRLALSKHSTLKVSTVVNASDAAGNRKTTTKQLTLRRAAG
jgi:hypothetical protein